MIVFSQHWYSSTVVNFVAERLKRTHFWIGLKKCWKQTYVIGWHLARAYFAAAWRILWRSVVAAGKIIQLTSLNGVAQTGKFISEWNFDAGNVSIDWQNERCSIFFAIVPFIGSRKMSHSHAVAPSSLKNVCIENDAKRCTINSASINLIYVLVWSTDCVSPINTPSITLRTLRSRSPCPVSHGALCHQCNYAVDVGVDEVIPSFSIE